MARDDQVGTSDTAIPRVNIAWIHPFFEILDQVAVPYEPILEKAGLPNLAIDDGSAMVPTASIYGFVALAAESTDLEDLGFQAGQRLAIEVLLPDVERAWARPGVFRSVESFISAALESSSNVDMWLEQREAPDNTTEFFYLGTFGPDHPAFTTVEQYMVALMVRSVRYGASPRWNPDRINLRAPSVPRAAALRLAGDAVIRTAQKVTSIVFSSQRFVGPIQEFPKKGSTVWRRHRRSLQRSSETSDISGSLRLVLPAYLPDGSPDIHLAARLVGTSVRTLQRRLREEGVTFSQLIDSLRHDLAIYLLRDPQRRASEISRELGYRDPAIFTRAFRRWTGQTPSQYRASLGA